MKSVFLLITACFLLLTVACGDDDNDSPTSTVATASTAVAGQGGSNNASACRQLTEFQQSLDAILRLGPGSSAADIAKARNDAQTAFAGMGTAMSAMSPETSKEIQDAYSKLAASLGTIAGVTNPAQLEETIKEPVAEMNRAVTKARAELC